MKKLRYCFWLVLLLHLLLFLSISVQWKGFSLPQRNETPLPAYVYREETNAEMSDVQTPPKKASAVSDIGLEKPQPSAVMTKTQSTQASKGDGEQNINLTLKADKNLNRPLLNLLTKATVAHLIYPKIAVDFRMRGMAQVGFTISPNGQVTNVSLLKSSGSSVLDRAAIAAIKNMSPVKQVNLYLEKPEFLVVDIIFG